MAHNDVGDELLISHEVRDHDGDLVNAATVVLTVTLPDLTTVTPTVTTPPERTGVYEATYTLVAPGRHLFEWQTTDPDTASSEALFAVEPGALPTVPEVREYLGSSADQWTEPELAGALAAETAAQARVCRVGAPYPADLSEALMRRVARNLALRSLPLAVLQGDAETGNTMLPGRDPEVRRFEAPYRKVTVG